MIYVIHNTPTCIHAVYDIIFTFPNYVRCRNACIPTTQLITLIRTWLLGVIVVDMYVMLQCVSVTWLVPFLLHDTKFNFTKQKRMNNFM